MVSLTDNRLYQSVWSNENWISDQIYSYSGGFLEVTGANATAGIFTTFPSENISQATGFADQMFATGLLLFCIRGLLAESNRIPSHFLPFLIGLVVLNIGVSFGFNANYAVNPARDFGPRVMTLIVGYGDKTFR